MCVHLPVGPSTTLCSPGSLASVLRPGVLSHPDESFQSSGGGAAAGAGGSQREEDSSPTNGFREFSCSAARLRNSCLSPSLFLCPCHSDRPLCLRTEPEACGAVPRHGPAGVSRWDNVSLCFQRAPGGRCAEPRCPETTARTVSPESHRPLTLQTGVCAGPVPPWGVFPEPCNTFSHFLFSEARLIRPGTNGV